MHAKTGLPIPVDCMPARADSHCANPGAVNSGSLLTTVPKLGVVHAASRRDGRILVNPGRSLLEDRRFRFGSVGIITVF